MKSDQTYKFSLFQNKIHTYNESGEPSSESAERTEQFYDSLRWARTLFVNSDYGEGRFSMDRSIISQLLLSFRSEPILCAGL